MTKYNKGSAAIITAVIVALILVAVGSFYIGASYVYRSHSIELQPQSQVVNNSSDTKNTNSAAGANTNTQEVAKPVITDEAIAAYFNKEDNSDATMVYKVIRPGFISAKSTEYSAMHELGVVARGDINSDGYEDIVLASFSCGASCGDNLIPLLNDKNGGVIGFKSSLDGYYGFKPRYSKTSIKDGIVYTTISNNIDGGNSVTMNKAFKLSGDVFVEVR